MPYPPKYAHGQTTPETEFEPTVNPSVIGVGNSDTIPGTTNDAGQIGFPMPPFLGLTPEDLAANAMMVFDGTTRLNRTIAYTTPPGAVTEATIVMRVRRDSAAGTFLVIGESGLDELVVTANGTDDLTFAFLQDTSSGVIRNIVNGAPDGVDTLVHIAANLATGVVLAWANGVPLSVSVTIDFGTTAVTLDADARAAIGSGLAGTSIITAQLGLVYLSFTLETDPQKFYLAGSSRFLGADGTLTGAPAPAIYLGGEHGAADWNAGTNLGTLDDFNSVTGTVTAV